MELVHLELCFNPVMHRLTIYIQALILRTIFGLFLYFFMQCHGHLVFVYVLVECQTTHHVSAVALGG